MNSIEDKKRNEKIELILNHQVEGQAFILTNSKQWKRVVLQHFNRYYRKEIDLNELLKIMKEQGVIFAQKDSLVKYPVLECLRFIAVVSKKELDIQGDCL